MVAPCALWAALKSVSQKFPLQCGSSSHQVLDGCDSQDMTVHGWVACPASKKAHYAEKDGAVSCDVKEWGCDRQATPPFGVWQPENSLEGVLIPVDAPTMLGRVGISGMV